MTLHMLVLPSKYCCKISLHSHRFGSLVGHTELQEPVVAAAGTNRWDTVHFSDPERQDKFQKLMVLP
jgi:hypothetical protein